MIFLVNISAFPNNDLVIRGDILTKSAPRGEVTSRSKQVTGEPADYKKNLAVIDRQYYHTARGVSGQRLESLGELLCLVVGAFGEVSEVLERMVKAIAESRELFLSGETGQPASERLAGFWASTGG